MNPQVIIVGAGPTGLTAAFFLVQAGVRVLVLERGQELFEDPRAATLHPPTLELFAPAGITGRILEQGLVARYWQFRGRAEGEVARFDLELLRGETDFPYRVQLEQHRLSRILLDQLLGSDLFELRWNQEVRDVSQDSDAVHVALPDRRLSAPFLIGADGGKSSVRKALAVPFEGFTYPERFLVITTTHDFEREGFCFTNYISDPKQWAAVFKVPGEGPPGRWRFTSPAQPDESEEQLLDFDAAKRRLLELTPNARSATILHTNLYVVHQRVAAQFHSHRILLAGDAAHVNNPLGGMGMNFGIHDAASAAEQLTAVIRGGDPALHLPLYDRRRRHVAHAYLQSMSIQNKALLEERDPAVRASRLEEMRRTANDPVAAKQHLLRTSMLESMRVAAGIQ